MRIQGLVDQLFVVPLILKAASFQLERCRLKQAFLRLDMLNLFFYSIGTVSRYCILEKKEKCFFDNLYVKKQDN